MTNYGDPEVHRRILQEACQDSRLVTHLQATVMGSLGSAASLSMLHGSPNSKKDDGFSRCHRLVFPLLSVTVASTLGANRYEEERRLAGTILKEAESLLHQSEAAGCAPFYGTSLSRHTTQYSDMADVYTLRTNDLEQNMEAHRYAQAYLNYLDGFFNLWIELFGPSTVHNNNSSSNKGTRNGGGGGGARPPLHLHGVQWDAVCTPERRAWAKALQDTGKDILFKVVTQELPVDMYLFYVLFANLSLRVSLLETVAELFVWSSVFVDVGYCVQRLYVSYRLQCEMARLQDVWASNGLIDESFLSECEHFNQNSSTTLGTLPVTRVFNAASQFGRLHDDQEEEGAIPTSLLSSTSEGPSNNTDGGDTATPREVHYIPVFFTRCNYTWLLQRVYWSMYGRCTLFFSSCISLQLARDVGNLRCWEDLCSIPSGPTKAAPHVRRDSHVGAPDEATSTRQRLDRHAFTEDDAPFMEEEAEEQHGTTTTTTSKRRVVGNVLSWIRSRRSSSPQAPPASQSSVGAPDALCMTIGSVDETTSRDSVPPFYFCYSSPDTAASSSADADGDTDGAHEAPPSEMHFLALSGCYVLASTLRSAIQGTGLPSTFMLITDNTTRPGTACWDNNRYAMYPTVDDPRGRDGLSPWVVNFVLPFSRLSQDAAVRQNQEQTLLRTIAFRVAGGKMERVCFTHLNSLFYVLPSGSGMDQNRSLFVLHYSVPSSAMSSRAEEEALLAKYKDTAFAALEELWKAWTMECVCREATKLAVSLTGERPKK